MKNSKVISLEFALLLMLLSSCKESMFKEVSTPKIDTTASPLSTTTPSIEMSTSQSTSTSTTTTLSIITPTPRVFQATQTCSSSKSFGKILFLQKNETGDRNRSSYYDLYMMDNDGCFPQFIMERVSGSPAWSPDGKQIAIGCDNNLHLCILDATATLQTCANRQDEIGRCYPAITEKHELPNSISADKQMYNISWSSDGSQVLVEGGDEITNEYKVYTLTLGQQGVWDIIVEGLGKFNIDSNPKFPTVAITGLFMLNQSDLQRTKLVSGTDPEWSIDGQKLAFVKVSENDTKEQTGIAILDIKSAKWEWAYTPANRDEYYWPSQNVFIHDSGNHKLLSWSPDERYIAFVALYRHMEDSQIFRLDLTTGEILPLTMGLKLSKGSQRYYAPAWSP